MIGHIYIYGEIDIYQDSYAADYGFVNLKGVTEAINSQPNAEEFHVHIHSMGGSVVEGMAIYDVLKATGKKITTINEGMCYSIATVIFMAGEERLTMPHAQFIIHDAWGIAMGDAEDIEQYSKELKNAVDKIVGIYSEEFNIDEETIRSIMKEDREMEVDEAIEIGLATSISEPLKAVAKFVPTKKTNINKKQKKMSKKDKKTLKQVILDFLEIDVQGKKNLTIKTADQTELVFADLEDDATPSVGDKATVNDEPAEGDYTLQDEMVYSFTDGELMAITEKEDDDEGDEPDPVALQQTIDDLEAEKLEAQTTIDTMTTDLEASNKKLKDLKALVSNHVVDDKVVPPKKKKKETSDMGEAIANYKNQ